MVRKKSRGKKNHVTIAEVLMARADRVGEKVSYDFGVGVEGVERCLSYGDLDEAARRVAGVLGEVAGTDSPVLLYMDTSEEFISGLFGCLYAGKIAVPTYRVGSPRSTQTRSRLAGVVRDSGAKVGLTCAELVEELKELAREDDLLRQIRWIDVKVAVQEAVSGWRADRREVSDVAILQYTSGSTREPRGVMVTNGNILANLDMMRRRQQYSEEHTFVSWLPLAHDWGLMGNVLLPMWCGSRASLMTPGSFLARPVGWLEAIERHANVTSGGPGFAYDYCVHRIPARERERLDLSSWCRAGIGAGRVSAHVLERFSAAFESTGFRREAFYNGYGLAEATLSVSATAPGMAPTVLRVDRGALGVDDARVAREEDATAIRVVGSGEPHEVASVRIVEPETGAVCPEGRVGEGWVGGAHVAAGYWNAAAETATVFGLHEGSACVRTGDLGFVHAGELFISGRRKDVMAIRGRNVYPEDVEWAVEGCHGGLRRGGVVAFEDGKGTEGVVIVHEIREGVGAGEGAEIVGAVRRAVAQATGIGVKRVVLVPPRAVPKTTSGKVRRRACWEAYVRGRLDVVFESGLERGDRGDGGGEGGGWTAVERVLDVWRGVLGRETIGIEESFVELGGDSLGAYECQSRLARMFGVEIPVDWFMADGATVGGVVRMLAERGIRGRSDG